jgi:sigma-E factor negative regulatory protein RseC
MPNPLNGGVQMNAYDGSVMKEEGVVSGLIGGMVKVETTQTEACSGCSAKGACSTMGGMKKREIVLKNNLGAKEGDHVVIAVPRSGVMSAGIMVYLIPVLVMIAAAALGNAMGPQVGLSAQDGSVICGLAGLALSWLLLYFISKAIGKQKALQIKLHKILKPGETLRPESGLENPGSL